MGALSAERMTTQTSQVRPQGQSRALTALLVGVVVAIATIFAGAMFIDYAAEPARLWRDVHHDRNGHFNFGLDLVLALQAFDLVEFFKQIAHARIWPPVHGLVLAFTMLLGGIDLRLAIVPSLIGWVGTMALTFLIALRLFPDRLTGVIAGAIALVFAFASPAFRLITADVMLEGLGAALTAFCFYAYLRALAEPDQGRWWGALALGLVVLFFEKSNYWVLAIIPLAIDFFWTRMAGWLPQWRARFAAIDMREALRRIARDPFAIALCVVACLVFGIYLRGPTVIEVFGRRVSLYPPENLVTVAWWLLCIRAVLLWRRHRKAFDEAVGIAGRRLFYWLAVPIAVSFLVPKRLATFIWYIGPTHVAEGAHKYDPFTSAVTQWHAFSQGFHSAPWAAVLVLGLAAVAVTQLPRRVPRARAIAIFAVLSAVAVLLHPQQQWRFQSTSLFAFWILAGAGGAILLSSLVTRLPRLLGLGIAAAAIAGIAAGASLYRWTDMAYLASIHPRAGPSDLDLAKVYLTHVAGTKAVGFLATFGATTFFHWTVREHCRCEAKVDTPWLFPRLTREEFRRIASDWLASTPAERIVIVDAPGLYPIEGIGYTYERLSGLIDAIENNPGFEKIVTETVPTLGATVTVWRRRSGSRAGVGASAERI
jgi:hypothetical protein